MTKSTLPHWEVYDGKGPYLLLVHGILSCRAQWLPNIEALSKNTRPVVVELFGHGQSPSPESVEAYHPDAYASAFEHIRGELGVSDWFICGQSLGACLTLNYALKHPNRVKGQIFTNTNSALTDDSTYIASQKNRERIAHDLMKKGPYILKKLPIHPVHARHLRKDVRTALLENCTNLGVVGIANTFLHTVPNASVRNRIHENRVPALLICGAREKQFKAYRNFTIEHMPHLDVIDLDAGHAVNIGAAEDFNRAVISFIHNLDIA